MRTGADGRGELKIPLPQGSAGSSPAPSIRGFSLKIESEDQFSTSRLEGRMLLFALSTSSRILQSSQFP